MARPKISYLRPSLRSNSFDRARRAARHLHGFRSVAAFRRGRRVDSTVYFWLAGLAGPDDALGSSKQTSFPLAVRQ